MSQSEKGLQLSSKTMTPKHTVKSYAEMILKTTSITSVLDWQSKPSCQFHWQKKKKKGGRISNKLFNPEPQASLNGEKLWHTFVLCNYNTHLKPWISVITSINRDGICETAARLPKIHKQPSRSTVPRMMFTIRTSRWAGVKLSFITGMFWKEETEIQQILQIC